MHSRARRAGARPHVSGAGPSRNLFFDFNTLMMYHVSVFNPRGDRHHAQAESGLGSTQTVTPACVLIPALRACCRIRVLFLAFP